MKKDLEILGLAEGASWIEIQEAYEKLSDEYDPKNNDNLEFFAEEFEKISQAYGNLKNNYKDQIDSQIDRNQSDKNDLNSNYTNNQEDKVQNIFQGNINKAQEHIKTILKKYSYKSKKTIHDLTISFENEIMIIDAKLTLTYLPGELSNTNEIINIPLEKISEIFFEDKPETDFLTFKTTPNKSIDAYGEKTDIYQMVLSKNLRKDKIKYQKLLESFDVLTKGRLVLSENLKSNINVVELDNLDFGDKDDSNDHNHLNHETNKKFNDKSFGRFFKYDNEYISGGTYFIRSMLNSILIVFLIGLYLQSVTAYKRSKSLGASKSSSKIWAVWGFLLWIFAFTPLSIITNTIPHFYLWFSNGKRTKQ